MKKYTEAFLHRYCLRRHDGESSAVPNCIRMCQAEKTKKTGMLIEIAPFAPQESGSGQLPKRSEAYPRRAQSTFDGSAVESAFALLLTKVTKPPAELSRWIHH